MRLSNVLKGIFLSLFLVIPLGLFAQDVPQIPDFTDLYENFGVYLGTYLGVAGIAMFLGEFVIRIVKAEKKLPKVVIVSALAVGVSFVGNLTNWGYLADATWYETVLWGGLSALAANGIWSGNWLFLKTVVEFIIGLIKAKQTPEVTE